MHHQAIPQAQFFITSYFGFGFTSAYNSILFCCLRRLVQPCCHTHDSGPPWLCITLGQSRTQQRVDRAWSSNTRRKQKAAGRVWNTNYGAPVIDFKAIIDFEILAYDIMYSTPPSPVLPSHLVRKNYNGVATRWWKKIEDIFIRFDTMNERDRHTQRYTARQKSFCTQQQILKWMNVTWSKMKKLHWTDSEFDRTHFLLLKKNKPNMWNQKFIYSKLITMLCFRYSSELYDVPLSVLCQRQRHRYLERSCLIFLQFYHIIVFICFMQPSIFWHVIIFI